MSELQIIPKRQTIPAFDPQGIKLKHITFYPSGRDYEGEQITEVLISRILTQIPHGINVFLSLNPDGEDDWLEVLCDGEWLSLGYCVENDVVYSYNSAFAGSGALTPLLSGGQSPVEACTAIQDIEAGVSAVEYFIRTGGLYPGIDWARL